jgi:hypothetical protein
MSLVSGRACRGNRSRAISGMRPFLAGPSCTGFSPSSSSVSSHSDYRTDIGVKNARTVRATTAVRLTGHRVRGRPPRGRRRAAGPLEPSVGGSRRPRHRPSVAPPAASGGWKSSVKRRRGVGAMASRAGPDLD